MKSEQNKNKQKKNRSNPFRSHVVGSGEEDERRSKQSGGRRCCDSLSRPVKHNADFPLGDCPPLSLSLSLSLSLFDEKKSNPDGEPCGWCEAF